MKHLLRWFRVHGRLLWESLRDALPLLFKLIAAMCEIIRRLGRRGKLSERERRRSPDLCVPINDPAFKRPDPLIYSQFYLMSLGLGVTWDNPDIQLFLGGIPVAPSDLKANTDYEVVARVWNNSTEAPVARLPVRFSYLSFGAGIVSHAISIDEVNLGVKGGSNHPAFAKATWRTPPTPAHYCIQVLLEWLDDVNPMNNLGNENTNVGKLSSPANFNFTLGNPTKERLEYRFETDAYRLLPPDPCREAKDPAVRRREAMARHNRNSFPLPDGWSVVFSPATPVLEPGVEETIAVTVNAPADFVGGQAINVHAFSRYGLAGGVTLYVEGV
jgi:hypothetical protein